MKKFSFIFIILLISGCSKLVFTAANTPTLTYDGTITKDVAYGDLPRQRMDIYQPNTANDRDLPVIVFFHGGRWSFGSKDQYQFVGMTLSSMGYVVVLPNTRLFPEVKFPAFVEDAAKSVAWVHQNIKDYGGSDNLFVSGHSSGAHIGALIIADASYLDAYGLSPDIINAFAGMAGPYDFVPKADDLQKIFGPPRRYPEMVVTNFIDGTEPPMLLLYSDNDETVHIRNLRELKKGISEKGGQVETIIYKKGGHTGTVAALSWANPSRLPVQQDIDEFFQQHTQ